MDRRHLAIAEALQVLQRRRGQGQGSEGRGRRRGHAPIIPQARCPAAIHEITSLIDELAFQTNILVLNAAVEAARAGEQGRGFAVVAAEVRNLAQRSAASAKEIKKLIGDSVQQVQDGTRLVQVAGKAMDQIVAEVRRVTTLIQELAAAAREQASGLDEVNRAVTQMDHVTQQNAALVEQASAAAESLKQQSQQLVGAVAVFQLPDEGGDAALATTTAPVQGSIAPVESEHSLRLVPPTPPRAHARMLH
ncbi:MAG: methyl-accepting chemotaxis protein [Ramlibacter sp.]